MMFDSFWDKNRWQIVFASTYVKSTKKMAYDSFKLICVSENSNNFI